MQRRIYPNACFVDWHARQNIFLEMVLHGPVAQWIRHRPTEPGIAGSSPAGFIYYFNVMAFASSCVHTRVRIFVPEQRPEHNDGMKLRGILATWCKVLCVFHQKITCHE